jgi:hypothetical protein
MTNSAADEIRSYHDQTVRLADLAALEDVIDGFVFERCQIVGPAVVALLGSTRMTGCQWSGDPEAIIWPSHGRDKVVGAIGLKDCHITGCEFFRVGMFVPDSQIDAVRAGFGL